MNGPVTSEARKQFLARLLDAALTELQVDGVYIVTATLDDKREALDHVCVYSSGPAACCDKHIALVLNAAGDSVAGRAGTISHRAAHAVVIGQPQ